MGSVLREMYRVVRPGGWIYCLESSIPETKEVKTAYNVYRNHMIPAASAVLNGNGWEYKRIARANSRFLSKKKLAGAYGCMRICACGILQPYGRCGGLPSGAEAGNINNKCGKGRNTMKKFLKAVLALGIIGYIGYKVYKYFTKEPNIRSLMTIQTA